jgi:hypothetical protein
MLVVLALVFIGAIAVLLLALVRQSRPGRGRHRYDRYDVAGDRGDEPLLVPAEFF